MTTLRESIRRLIQRIGLDRPRPPAPDLAYRLYWTKMARTWSPERRSQVKRALLEVVNADAFRPNEFRRVYRLPKVDDLAHAGASLLALLEVLEAFEARDEDQREEP